MTAPPVETWGDPIGGVPRLAWWADEHPGEFYTLMHECGFTLSLTQWAELLNMLPVEMRIAILELSVAEGLLTRHPRKDGSVVYRIKQTKPRYRRINPVWKEYRKQLRAYERALAAAEADPFEYPWPVKPLPPPFPPEHRGSVTFLIRGNEKTPKVAASEVLDVQPPAKETEREQ